MSDTLPTPAAEAANGDSLTRTVGQPQRSAGARAGAGTETIDAVLRAAAARHPERPAVIDGERSLTYAELDEASSRLANLLRARGIAPGERVGLYLEKSLESLVAIYAILKAGASYVPLDDQAPVRRLGYIMRDAGIEVLISHGAQAQAWPALRAEGAPLHTVVCAGAAADGDDELTVVPWSVIADQPSGAPEPQHGPDSLAYILYTSGSTGEPKGVMLSHRNGLAFVQWAAQDTGLTEQDRLSSHAPLHFDLSTFDLYAAACGGAAVVLVPRSASVFPIELARFIREQRITVWYSVPSILTQLVLRGDFADQPPQDLRTIIFAGEVFPMKYLRRLIELVPHARYLNYYGPTETNVCTWYEVPTDGSLGETLPIGIPIGGGTRATVRDERGQPVAPGEVGELLITGPTVMHGYWGDPERTARTLARHGDERTYRTGDLVRELADGNLEFLGRRDAQIKTRGYRVELGEIEAALNAIPAVLEAAVLAVPDEKITNRLRAFVALRQPIGKAELISACSSRVPRYMVPDEWVLRDELPKSSTGKIDRRRLAQESR